VLVERSLRVKKLLVAVVALVLIVPCAASAMDVATWLAKAEALKAKGVLALANKDYKLLEGEIKTNAGVLKQERMAAVAAGRKPAYCPPEKANLNQQEVFDGFNAVPAAQRPRTPVIDALRLTLAKKYPCR
jgi:hypothetical protein